MPLPDFDTVETYEEPFKYKGKSYILREASSKACAKYRDARNKATRVNPDGKFAGFSDLHMTETYLLSYCIFEVRDGKELPVSQEELLSWPNRVTKPLFAKIEEVSDLYDEGEERQQLVKALSLSDSPISITSLQEYIGGLPVSQNGKGDEFHKIKVWIKPTAQEQAKNSQSATQDT